MSPSDDPTSAGDDGERPAPASLEESLHRVAGAGRESLSAAFDSGRAWRGLVAADLALARSALGRALAWVGVAIAFGASSWLLLMAALVSLLQRFGMSWLAALSIAALLSLGVTAFAGWRAMAYFEHTKLDATRRQLARLGLGGHDGDDEDA